MVWLSTSRALVAFAALVCAAGCKSNNAAHGAGGAAGSGAAGAGGGTAGTGGSGAGAGSDAGGDGCAATAGAGGAVDIDGCPTAYMLNHYDGGTCGLCDPGLSMQCSNAMGCDWAAVQGAADDRQLLRKGQHAHPDWHGSGQHDHIRCLHALGIGLDAGAISSPSRNGVAPRHPAKCLITSSAL